MNTCLYKHNLNSLSIINDWTPIIFNKETKYIDVDDRYLSAYRGDKDIEIKQIHLILKLCFQHYFILIEYPINHSPNSQMVKDVKNEFINLIELGNQGLLKIYNYYNYYNIKDAHLLKDLNLMNSIQLNQYKYKFLNNSDLDGIIYSSTHNYFDKNKQESKDGELKNIKNDEIHNKEIKKEYFFNTNNIFNFLTNNRNTGVETNNNLPTIKEDADINIEQDIPNNTTLLSIDNTTDESSTDNDSNHNLNNDNLDNKIFTKSFNETINKQPILQCVDANDDSENIKSECEKECKYQKNIGNKTGNNKPEDNKLENIEKKCLDNTDECIDNCVNNCIEYIDNKKNDDNDTYHNRDHSTFTGSCVNVVKDMYQNICLFFFSIKNKIVNNFNYYFRSNRERL
jgi:hypothetical protein